MRKSMVRLFATFVCIASLTAGFIACSGSDDQDVTTTPDAGGGFDASLPDTSQPDTSAPDTGADTGPKDSGPQYDAGPPVTLDGGDLYEGGVPCVQGGLLEEEPNDDTTTANELSPTDAGCTAPGCSRCGVIFVTDLDAGPDGGTESDFLTFTVRPGVKDFYLQFAGNVTLTVTVEGHPPVVISQTQSPTLPLVRGKPYFVEVKSASGKKQTWRVTLFEIL
jgi:hypothetical protein